MKSLRDIPFRALAAVVEQMPADRREWGEAMLAELAQVEGAGRRWGFAMSCLRVALFPPGRFEAFPVTMIKSMLPTLGIGSVVAFALLQPEISGAALAWAFVIYGMGALAIPTALFGNVIVLGLVAWAVIGRALGGKPWPKSVWIRRTGRLAIELMFGLLNPVLYLSVLSSAFPLRPAGSEWWLQPLTAVAWVLLGAFWIVRICGGMFDPRARAARIGVRVLLWASLACLLAFAQKDARILLEIGRRDGSAPALILMYLRFCPLYLIPALLLLDYLRLLSEGSRSGEEPGARARGFFLLSNRAARFATFVAAGLALVTFALATYRRSESNARKLVSDQRTAIEAAAARYDVDPRLIGAIIFVTHRDQLSPLRDSFERLIVHTWSMRAEPLNVGSDPMLNIALDISVGVAQIKPRTAQTASVLATGHTPANLPEMESGDYRNVEPVGEGWPPAVMKQMAIPSPIPVPAERPDLVSILLNTEKNIETCALILGLYQQQWEAANPDWSIRKRPEILATLYQIGFARSKPHGAPRSNAFGDRVREVSEQAWMGEMFKDSI